MNAISPMGRSKASSKAGFKLAESAIECCFEHQSEHNLPERNLTDYVLLLKAELLLPQELLRRNRCLIGIGLRNTLEKSTAPAPSR